MATWNRFFTGLVDEARVYNATLSAEEVQIFSFIKPTNASSLASKLVFYANFNDIKKDDISNEVRTTFLLNRGYGW